MTAPRAQRFEAMLPKIALVGRTNVGKSTLFNRLTETRHALVSPIPGTTRTPNIGVSTWRAKQFYVVDTGGLVMRPEVEFEDEVREQVEMAVAASDLILFVIDLQDELLPQEREIAKMLKRNRMPVILVGNKADNSLFIANRFNRDWLVLGFGVPRPVSAVNGVGVGDLLDEAFRELGKAGKGPRTYVEPESIPVAIIGKPNVGKSSLFNMLIGERRAIVSPVPHTTRESHDVIAQFDDVYYRFIDTAGVRKQARVEPGLERAGVKQSLHSIENADVVLLLLDATDPGSTQEKKLAQRAGEAQKGLILVVNKWDLMEDQSDTVRQKYIEDLRDYYPFLSHAPIVFVSALTGFRVHQLFDLIKEVSEARRIQIDEARLSEFVRRMVAKKLPTRDRGTRHPRILSLRQVDVNPPTFEVAIKMKTSIHESYLRFLENQLRLEFGFVGTPVVVYAKKIKV